MEQKPEGLVCRSCGFSVQVLDEDGAVIPEIEPAASDRGGLKWLIASGLLLVALAGAGFWYWGVYDGAEQSPSVVIAEPPAQTNVVQADDQNLIAYTDAVDAGGDQVRVLGEASCLRLPGKAGDAVDQINWLDLSGTVVSSLVPQLPANWSLAAACRSKSGRVQTLASSADGLVLSGVDPNGAILWTRILAGDRRDAALAVLPGPTDQTLVRMRTGPQAFEVRTFDPAGQELWRREFIDVAPGRAPELTTNRVGDLVVAWNERSAEGDLALRVLALSAQNTVNFDETYSERTVGLSGLAGDDLANTYILEGEAGFSVQKIRADGTSDWRRWLDASARPIGIVFDGADLVVAAHQDDGLTFWRLNEAGQRSDAIPVSLEVLATQAHLEGLDDDRARITLWGEDGTHRQILVNLVRLREAAVIEAGEFLPSQEPERESDPIVDAISPVEVPAQAERPIETDPGEATAPTDVDAEPVTRPEAPITPPVEDTEAASDAAPVERDPSPAPEPETTEAEEPVASDPPVEVTPPQPETEPVSSASNEGTLDPSPRAQEAMCTFFCAALDNSEVTYPMTETIELGEDEPLESLEARLEDIHDRICTDSGGQLVVESLPNCTAQ